MIRYAPLFALLLLSACRLANPEMASPELASAVPAELPGYEKDLVFQAGRITFAGQPDEQALRDAAENGVVAVISLRTDRESPSIGFDEPALVRDLGMEFVSIPMTPSSFNIKDVDRLEQILTEYRGPVILHCRSANRVGAIWAAYLTRHVGVEKETALQLGRAAGLVKPVMVEATERVIDSDD